MSIIETEFEFHVDTCESCGHWLNAPGFCNKKCYTDFLKRAQK